MHACVGKSMGESMGQTERDQREMWGMFIQKAVEALWGFIFVVGFGT